MIIIILMILEGLCAIAIAILRLLTRKNLIENESLLNLQVGFIIIASIINWFGYGSDYTSLSIIPINGYYGGENLNVIGLAYSIIPPIITIILSYIIYQIINLFRYILYYKGEKK